MSSDLIIEIYDYVLSLTLDMGALMKEGYNTNLSVSTKKATWDVVTEYDRRIEKILVEKILQKYPNHKFVAEENSSTKNSIDSLTNDPTWLIDPIDGTANYIRNNPITGISLGFLIDKEIIIGIVYNPIHNQLFTAIKGRGAFLNGTKIFTRKTTEIDLAVVGLEVTLARRDGLYEKNVQRLQAVVKKAQGVRSFGSVAMSLCYVANGSIDAYNVDDLEPWDMAAGALIIQEAGGCVLNTRGEKFDVMVPKMLCAGTEELCRELVTIFKDVNIY